MTPFTLQVSSYVSPHSWTWRLLDANGDFIEDHTVDLNPADPLSSGFLDLPGYLRANSDPKRPLAKERELLNELGEWLGTALFGQLGQRLVDMAPCVVKIQLPEAARPLLYKPLELTFVDGKPLACQDITLVHLPPGAVTRTKPPVGNTIRMLAVFSLPDNETSLVLREQRRALSNLFNRLRAIEGRDVELTVLQWAVTRDSLRDALEDGAGWDVLHFSGHGLSDGLVFETSDGGTDRIPVGELMPLLHLARHRLKLVVLSSCHSAGAVITDRPALLPSDEADGPAGPKLNLANLAEQTVRQTGAAVLAMRYSVADDFSIELTHQLYDRMFGKNQPLSRALQLALPVALGEHDTVGVPPLSMATPALFGELAANLDLTPGLAPAASFSLDDQPMAHFPTEPSYLVGRSREMSVATSAFAPTSGIPGVLFLGPIDIGTTTCAVELAYRHVNRFRKLLWHEVHTEGHSIAGTLERFATSLDNQVPTLGLAAAVAGQKLDNYLIRLTEMFERHGILLVIDGIDVLLTTNRFDSWRDPRWGKMIGALVNHHGLSRTVLTSSRRPTQLSKDVLVVEPTPLSPLESVLLARQLPTLGQRMRGLDSAPAAETKDFLARTLTATKGIPGQIVAVDKATSSAPIADPAPEYLRLLGLLIDELS